MRELDLIAALPGFFEQRDPRVVMGIGDDAAVVRGRGYAVTSVDTMVDGIHFRTEQLTPGEIGHRALAAALSDLAAMGAEPGEAYLALGVPPANSDEIYLTRLLEGAQALASHCGVTIAGGDVTSAPALIVSFTVVGWTADPGELAWRSGARVGDLIGVSGELGDSGAGLALIEGRASLTDQQRAEHLRTRYARPQPRLEAGRWLARSGVTAMIDLSDGLATDARHLGRAGGVRLEISLAQLPLSPGTAEVAAQLGKEPAAFAAQAGEDYELCFCAAPGGRGQIEAGLAGASSPLRVTWIGRVLDGAPGVVFTDGGDPVSTLTGFEHLL